MGTKVSVIVPIYKAEKYIARCATSLFNQTLEEIEFIFVNDCTPDHSIEILEQIINRFPNRKNNIKIINHSENKGVSISRQDGFDVATGFYVIHCDPDDWVESNMYERLYYEAESFHYDMVICNYFLEYENKTIIQSPDLVSTNAEYILNKMVEGNIHGGLCNKLIRREIIIESQIKFTPGLSICEDLIYCLKILKANPKIGYYKHPFYHYDKHINNNSLTRLTTNHGKTQYKIWLSEFENIFQDRNSRIYATGYTYIAFWAFTHNILTSKEYRTKYIKKIKLLINNNRNIGIKLITVLSSLGLKKPLFSLYRAIKRF